MEDCKKFEPFYEFIAPFKIKNFKVSEILVAVTRKYNRIPPKSLWSNIICTVIILDELREHLNMPIMISSGYRNKKYNKLIDGAIRSQHMAFTALDFHVKGATPSQVKNILLEWRNTDKEFILTAPIKRRAVKVDDHNIPYDDIDIIQNGHTQSFQFSGGLGIYDTFVHIDTRGVNEFWDMTT